MSWCLGSAGPLTGTPGWGWLQSQPSGARAAFQLAMARSHAAARSCTGSFSLPSSGLATLGLLLWTCRVCPVAPLLHAVRREQGAGTGFLSLGSPGWGQPSWTCLEHTPVVGWWELPPHLALFLSEEKSAVLFNLGSHQRALAGAGINPPAGPTAACTARFASGSAAAEQDVAQPVLWIRLGIFSWEGLKSPSLLEGVVRTG